MGLAKFCVRLDGPAVALNVNGAKVSHVTGIALQAAAGHVPRLIVELDADGVLEGEGIVETRVAGAVDQGEAVVGFLAALDPDELEKAVLSRGDWGDEANVFVTALAVLGEWAAGKA